MSIELTPSWWILSLAALLTLGFCIALIPLAQKFDLVDLPGTRKVHQTATPLTGGPAIYIVLFVVAILALPTDRFLQALGFGGLVMVITGMTDDRHHLSAALRFLVQIGAGLLMVFWADIRLEDFGRLMWDGTFELGWLAVPVTLFSAIGVINAFNMIDGMDGLAGGVFLIATAGMTFFAALAGQSVVSGLLLIAMASVFGFLVINGRFPWNGKARVFLGDAGSLLLGFVLAWSFILLGNGEDRVFTPMTAVWLFAVPLLDTTILIWRRWKAGEPVFTADQYHIHHAFLRAGFSVTATWWSIILLAAFFAMAGVLFEIAGAPDYVSFYTFIGIALVYFIYMRRSWYLQRFLGRDFVYGEFDVEAGVS